MFSGEIVQHCFVAGIQEDDEPPSSSRSILKKFLKSSKLVITAVATAGGTAKGGSIGGLIASKLTDAIIPDEDEEEKPSKIKPTQKLINKQVKKINHQKKLKEEKSKMNVDVAPDANEPMDTTAIPTAEKRKPVKAPAVKPCIVYITLLPCSVGSKRTKCLAAITVVYPHCRLLHWWLTCEYTGYQP